jgi:hypothetical protein
MAIWWSTGRFRKSSNASQRPRNAVCRRSPVTNSEGRYLKCINLRSSDASARSHPRGPRRAGSNLRNTARKAYASVMQLNSWCQLLSLRIHMITDKIKELSATKARVERLEKSIASSLKWELAQLPARYGFGDLGEFVEALRNLAGRKNRFLPTNGTKATPRRKRATITDTVRAHVKKLVGAGNTGSHIAKTLKISLPSVQNIKKVLGLVKGRKKTVLRVQQPEKVKPASKKAPAKKASAPKIEKKAVGKRLAIPKVVPAQEAVSPPAA